MGSNSSKTNTASEAAAAAPTTTTAMDLSPLNSTIQWTKKHIENNLLDPRSPDVNRTPIILSNRLNKRPTIQEAPVTPVNLRKTLLNYSAKELKSLDPRSPSQFIPRTPISMAFNAESIDTSNQNTVLEYSGDIEEASCRNFNERLANITFDDLLGGNENGPKANENKLEQIVNISTTNAMDVVAEQQIEEENRDQTPNASMIHQTNAIEMDDENISPVVDTTSTVKRNTLSAVSSTPISTSTNQLKSLLIKKHSKKLANKTEIFTENIEMTTPTKRLAKINEVDNNPRTPFGCLLNRRSKSVENVSQQSFGLKENQREVVGSNDENATPKKPKSTAMMKHINRSGGGVRRKNDIFQD